MPQIKQNQLVLYVGAECHLAGAPSQLVKALKKRLTLQNPKYQAARKYGRWVGKKFPQKLYFYKERKAGLFMPRGFAKEAVLQCLELIKQKPTIIDNRRQLKEYDFQFKGILRDYQDIAVEDVLGRDFGVLEAGTGSGKTVMALNIIAIRRQPAIVIVHTKELLYQWAERIQEFLGIEASLIGDGHGDIGPVTVAIVNSARKIDDLGEHFGHALVDECHRVPASLFTDVVTKFDAKYSLGLSATAYRRENVLTKLIYFYMGDRSHRVDSRKLQETGAVLKPEVLFRTTGFVYKYRDDYSSMLKALSVDDARNRQIADDVRQEAVRKKGVILVVSDRVAHCERLAELLTERGCTLAVLTGKLNQEQRAEIVEKIKGNSLDILISTLQLIGEGFDAPGLNTLFLATPIKFSGRLKQVVGRILRPAEGKQAVVYDYVDEKVGVLKNSARQRHKTYQQYEFGF